MRNKVKQQKFEELHAGYNDMVYRLCLGYVKADEAQAKDLQQEVFINVWNALERFRGDSSPKTWIYRISVNTCLLYLRNKKDATNLHEERIAEVQDEETKTYDNLYEAIGKLNEVDRLIIMMVLDELEYGEIAQVMGLTEGNLRVKIHRIKKNLKTLLNHG